MGSILSKYTFDRNTLKRNSELSSAAVREAIEAVRKGDVSAKVTQNIVGALSSFMGVFRRENRDVQLTTVAENFLVLYNQSPIDAWRWLLTRSLWLFVVPNGTHSAANDVARQNQTFNLFSTVLKLCLQLQAEQDTRRFLYFDEFCEVFDSDDAWYQDELALILQIATRRQKSWIEPKERIGLIDALERQYGIPRDNLSTVLVKAFGQTGLFQFARNGGGTLVGIGLADQLDAVMQRRIRFAVDHPALWTPTDGSWEAYLDTKSLDLPVVASLSASSDNMLAGGAESPLAPEMITQFVDDLTAANLVYDATVLRRLLASLLAKNFIILAGQSGSGKTRAALALAKWFARPSDLPNVLRMMQGAAITASSETCELLSVDDRSVSVKLHDNGDVVSLPMKSVEQWVAIASQEGVVELDPKAAGQLLRRNDLLSSAPVSDDLAGAITVAIISAWNVDRFSAERGYKIIPVGADWTSGEPLLGYADALDPNHYVRRSALDIILEAHLDPDNPYFLILDEMNLSHVERYFSAFLSAAESGDVIELHSTRNENGMPIDVEQVPCTITIPNNLYLIGTINVDETTYTFSPKVLDRANVIEMRTSLGDLSRFLPSAKPTDFSKLIGKGRPYARSFCAAGRADDIVPSAESTDKLSEELELLFSILAASNREFGLRTAREIVRFVGFYETLMTKGQTTFDEALDAQVIQKILPRFNGSSDALVGALRSICVYCFEDRDWQTQNGRVHLSNCLEIAKKALEARSAAAFAKMSLPGEQGAYPTSLKKSLRLLAQVEDTGFVSFSEA